MSQKVFSKTYDGKSICSLLTLANIPSQKLALILHGFNSHKNNSTIKALTANLINTGYNVISLDFRGCGESSGNISETSAKSGIIDTQSVLAQILNEHNGLMDHGLTLIGFSFGATIAMAASNILKPQLIIAQAPVLDIVRTQNRRRTKRELTSWETDGYIKLNNEIGEVVLNYSYISDTKQYNFFNSTFFPEKTKLSIIHGTNDKMVPIEITDDFVRENPEKVQSYMRVENGNHNLSVDGDKSILLNFIEEQLTFS